MYMYMYSMCRGVFTKNTNKTGFNKIIFFKPSDITNLQLNMHGSCVVKFMYMYMY